MKNRILAAVFTATLFVTGAAQAQVWPEKPIKLIVPTGAGAATDIMARLLAASVGDAVGGSIFVENIPGASGIPAHQAAARAPADGYTFIFSNTSGMATNLVTFKKLPYDPLKNFAAVAMVTDVAPQIVSVNKDAPIKTLTELFAFAKANPEKASYAVDATAGSGVYSARLLKQRGGVEIAEVAYRSTAQMLQDAVVGRVPVLVSSISAARPFIESGDLRHIAVFSNRRFPSLPDVPTVAETLHGLVLDGWFVVMAPTGTPTPIVDRMNKAIGEFLKGADIQKRLLDIGLATSGAGTPASTAEFIAVEQKRWLDLSKEISIAAQ